MHQYKILPRKDSSVRPPHAWAVLSASVDRLSVYLAVVLAVVPLSLLPGSIALAQKPETVTVRWGGTTSIELQTPLFVAMSQGFLADAGIRVDNVMLAPGPRVREALAAGALDFADVGAFTYIVGRQKELPQRIILEYYSREIFSLVVRTALQHRVKSVADLKGLTVGVTAMGSSTHLAALSFIRKSGLSDTDVKLLALQSADPAVWITTIEKGTIDAGIVVEPLQTHLIDRKAAFALIDVRKQEDHLKWVGERAASMVLATNEDMIQKRGEVVQRAVNAIKRALGYIASHSSREVAEATARSFKMEVGTLERILDQIKGNFSRDGAISRSGLDVEVGLALTGGVLKRPLSYEEMVDTRFAGATR